MLGEAGAGPSVLCQLQTDGTMENRMSEASNRPKISLMLV